MNYDDVKHKCDSTKPKVAHPASGVFEVSLVILVLVKASLLECSISKLLPLKGNQQKVKPLLQLPVVGSIYQKATKVRRKLSRAIPHLLVLNILSSCLWSWKDTRFN